MALRTPRLAVGIALAGATLAACSSAPAPAALDQDQTSGTTGVTAPGSTNTTGTVPPGAPGTTGAVPLPGSTTGGGTPGTSGGTTGGGATTGAVPGTTGTGGTTGGTTGTQVDTSSVHLFTAKEDYIGLSPTKITLCAHAALTYAPAFNTGPEDLNVYWTAINTEKGGIYGRKVEMTYEDDAYKPDQAKVAAQKCVAKKPFLLLGGIGVDQIPTVRNYVETGHQLYVYHTATEQGAAGKKYSFTPLPSVEKVGESFAQLADAKYKGKRIGILKRESSNWEPGVTSFKALAKKYGLNVVKETSAAASAGNYTNQITQLKNAKAEVVFIWLNALETTEVIKQMKAQLYSPNLMVFPFNLTSQTLAGDALKPAIDGVAMYPAYSKGDYAGTFASYADDMKEFEAQYAKYDPGVDLSGVAGDLLFLNWVGQKALHKTFLQCGKDCSRNKFVELTITNAVKPISSGCPVDFSRDGHLGGEYLTWMQTYRTPSGKVNWRETRKCVKAP
jgi:ABC-type branched-subunit amino acid transport system substrate-binding protein